MKKKVVATGISGLVGSRIVELLGEDFNFVNFSLDAGVDITDFNLLKKRFKEFNDHNKQKNDIIIHLAAFTDVSRAWAQKGDKNSSSYKVNVNGSKNIAQLCKKYKKYLIHISTDFVFNGKKTYKNGYTEKNQPEPIEWYGQTKLWAEQEVQKSGCKNVILRIAFPYKAKKASQKLEPKPKLDLVRKIKEKLENKEQLKMFNDQVITPTFIDDIAQVIGFCIKNKPQGIYHCVGSTSLSPFQLAGKVADVFSLDNSLIKESSLQDFLDKNPNARPRQKKMIISNHKLQQDFGIKMLTVDEGLKKIKKQLT